MKLLVTGGSGFFGRNFIEQYEELHHLSAPTEKQLNLMNIDSINKFFSKDYFDVILHLADKVTKRGGNIDSNALVMFRNIQRAAIVNRVFRLVIIGDGSEFNTDLDLQNVSEDEFGIEIPESIYGVTRFLVNSLAAKDKITTNLRHFIVYGKYASPYENIISAMAYYAAIGKDIVLKNDKLVSVIYIDDSLKIINAAINGEIPKTDYNIVAKNVRLSQVARSLKRISGNQFEVIVENKKFDYEYTANNNRLLETMPNLKFTSMNKGLTVLYEWISGEIDNFNIKKIKL